MTSQMDAKSRPFKIPGWVVLIIFTVAVNVFAIWWSQRSIWPTPKVGATWQMPTTLKTLSGEPLDLQKMISTGGRKFILINIWASWCAPCVAEFPSLVEMAKYFEKEKRLLIVGVSVDEDRTAAQKFLKSFGSSDNFVAAFDENKIFAESVGTFKLPETYLVDARDNKLIRKFTGSFDWYDRSMLKLIENELSKE